MEVMNEVYGHFTSCRTVYEKAVAKYELPICTISQSKLRLVAKHNKLL